MKVRTILFCSLILLAPSLFAWETTRFIVYSNITSNYSHFMDMTMKKVLSDPIRKREIHIDRRGLDKIGTDSINPKDKILLLVHARDMNDDIKQFIKDHGKDPNVFIWITGQADSPSLDGVDAVTGASDNWDENEKALNEYIPGFVSP